MYENVLVMLFLLLLFIGIVIWLQIFLSKRENRWVGLLLPFITLMFSIIAILGLGAYSSNTLSLQTVGESGEVVNEVITSTPLEPIMDKWSFILMAIVVFMLYNISTAILLAIYISCRKKLKVYSDIDKMNVQDLE